MEKIGEGFTPFELKEGPYLSVAEAAGQEERDTGKCFAGGAGRWMQNMTRVAGIKWENLTLTNTILCRPPDNVYPTDPKAGFYISREDGRRAVEHCARVHLWPNIEKAGKEKIFAVGNHALVALTGKRGIHQWRGSPLPLKGGDRPRVIPTLHPAALMRQAKLTSACISDLRKSLTLPPENYNLFPTLVEVQAFRSESFAFDFEWDRDGEISLCGLSDRFYSALVVPFIDPYIEELRRIFEAAQCLIGHNIVGADLAHLERLGWKLRGDVRIEDTMLKQHLVQPDYPHGLDFVASIFTNKVFWKGKWKEEMDEENEGEEATGQQWKTWEAPDALPRSLGGYGGCLSAKEAFALYNARDTDAEFQIDTPINQMLLKWGLRPIYENVSRPSAYICRWMSDHGLRLDTSRLGEIRQTLDTKIEELEGKLPDGLRPYEETVGCNLPAPPGSYRPKVRTCRGSRKNSHDAVDIVFARPDEGARPCPICGKVLSPGSMAPAKILKGTTQVKVVPYNSPPKVQAYVDSLGLKTVLDHKTKRPTTGKKARGIWAKDHPEFVVLGVLKQQITLRNNFAKECLLGQERMYFNLKVHGTAEGRLSSSGRRKGIDLNIQNQPEHFRIIYVPDHPGWGFLNLDVTQGENFLTTWLAKDWERWERLQDPEYDEHGDLASRIFGRPVTKALAKHDEEVNALRQIGKKINHGRNYGMGVKKQQEELISQGFDHFTQADVKEFIAIWQAMNKRTAEWQKETIEIAQRQGYLKNPFGRIRWFTSHNLATQALAFLPASTLADMVLRMMICHYPQYFMKEIEANQMSIFHPLCDDWVLSIQVHDSLVPQGPWETHLEQAERSHRIMTQPWPQLDGFQFRVDIKGGTKSWGEGKSLALTPLAA